MLPNDPVMLLSFINLDKLSGIDYHYDKEKNQFV